MSSAMGAGAAASCDTKETSDQVVLHSDDSDSEDDKVGLDAWFAVLGSRSSTANSLAKLRGVWNQELSAVMLFEGIPKKLASSMGFTVKSQDAFYAVEALYLFDAEMLDIYPAECQRDSEKLATAWTAREVYANLLPAAAGAAAYKAYCQLRDAGYIVRINSAYKADHVAYEAECPIPQAGQAAAASPACVLYEVYVRLRTDFARSRPGIPVARVVILSAESEVPTFDSTVQLSLLQACAAADISALERFVDKSKPHQRNALEGGVAAEFLMGILLNSCIPATWRRRAAAAAASLLPSTVTAESLWHLLRAAWPITTQKLPVEGAQDLTCSVCEAIEEILGWVAANLPAGDAQPTSVWHAVVDSATTVTFLKALPCDIPPGNALF